MNKQNDIIFINPPNSPFSSKGILIEPIDLLGLASWTQNRGHACSILDMDVKNMQADDLPAFFNHQWPRIMVIVFDYHIPLHDSGTRLEVKRICEVAKDNGVVTILGGKLATFGTPAQKLDIGADIFIHHEMEHALDEVLTSLQDNRGQHPLEKIPGISFRQEKTIFVNEARKEKVILTELPRANRSLIDLKDYIDVRTILSSRGCNLKCTFCHVPGFWGVWRARSAEQVVDEIQYLVDVFAVEKILFLDDNATAQPKRMQEISQHLISRNIKVKLGCLGTIHKFDPQTIQLMAQAGFRWIHYGAESADDLQLREMGKRITSAQIVATVKATQAAGLRVRTSWIMDMPGMSTDTLLRNKEVILSQGSEEIRLHFLTLRLGSILQEMFSSFETPQFIHRSQQNLNISGVSQDALQRSVEEIIQGLRQQGYVIVKNADDFIHVNKLKEMSPGLKVASLCPLRYGLGW